MSAASTVFSIIELLQEILSELPPLDIIRYQRVNSAWRKLITGSPLLQYKTWLRNDFPDPAYHIRANDLMPEDWNHDRNKEMDFETKRYNYNVSKHLHPIIVARIMQHPPDDPRFSFDPLHDMDKDGFGGYFNFRPILLRDLMQWYEKNRATEHIWGNMSLFRPDARKLRWETTTSGDAGIPFHLEAVQSKDLGAEVRSTEYTGNDVELNRKPGQPPVLTLSDLMRKLDDAWHRWIESEHEEHHCGHDGGTCDFDQGIPGEGCLTLDDENDGEEEEEEYEVEGERMTMEEHIERAILAASS